MPYQSIFGDNVRLVLEILILVTAVANFGHEWYHYQKSHVGTGPLTVAIPIDAA
jgi:hypothetical protein